MKIKKDFHPRLFGFAGFSGSGKTTLIEKLIGQMNEFQVGYIKHDAHKFEMDHPGKDTYRQYKAGAKVVFINDSSHFALQINDQSFNLEKEYFKDCDLVLVEGHKYADHPKFLFLDDEGLALKEFLDGKITNVIGVIYSKETVAALEGIPSFSRDDVESIFHFINSAIQKSVQQIELYGLILTGGKSSRMGTDKSLINYHGTPHARYLYEMLEAVGIKSFLSCREGQLGREGLEGLPTIVDRFVDFGPLGGILSAMANYPEKAWIVLACDLPLLTEDKVKELIRERNPLKQATAFFNQERKQFEPLFAIYEPQMYSRLLYFLGNKSLCPQKALFNSSVKKLDLTSQSFLENANTPEEKKRVIQLMKGESCEY